MNRRKFTAMLAALPFVGWVTARLPDFAVSGKHADPYTSYAVRRYPVLQGSVLKGVGICTRCSTLSLVNTRVRRPTGMTWFTPASSDFTLATPQVEQVCGACLTDNEILEEGSIADIVCFVVDTMRENAKRNSTTFAALDEIEAHFLTRSNFDESERKMRNRKSALKAIGL